MVVVMVVTVEQVPPMPPAEEVAQAVILEMAAPVAATILAVQHPAPMVPVVVAEAPVTAAVAQVEAEA
jgi:hypothetical protein